jgi:pilus assembly protein CpaF
MTSGHGGSLSTVHATYPHDTLHRLETLCLMSDVELPLTALRGQIGSAINVIVQTSRLNDGSRKITHVAECLGLTDAGGYKLKMLFEWKQTGVDAKGKVLGSLSPTGELPTFVDEIEGKGLKVPPEMEMAARK